VSTFEPAAARPPVRGASHASTVDLGVRAARGGSLLLLRHAVAFAANAAGGVLLARRLGPEIMGLFFAAATLLVIGRQLVDFGTTPRLIRAATDANLEARALWLERLLAIFLLVATGVALGLGAARLYAPESATQFAWLLGAAALGASVWAWQAVPLARLERQLDYARVSRVEVLEPLVFNAVAVGGALAGAGVPALAAALVLRGVVPAVAAQSAAPLPKVAFPGRQALRTEARSALPLVGAQATLWAILAAPPVLIGMLVGHEALGHAQLAQSLVGSAGIPAAVFQRVTFAGFARLRDEPARFRAAVGRSLELLALVSLPVLGGLAAFAPAWVPRVCGPAWTPMVPVLVAAVLPAALAGLLGILYSAMLALGSNRIVLAQNLVHAGLYWAAMATLARPFGALAVPLAHAIAIPSGWVYLRGFAAHHALPPLGGVLLGLVGETAITAGCLWLVIHGHIGLAVLVFCVLHAVIVSALGRRLGLTAILRSALGRRDVELPGV
jgi:PST family polysaccharide transporter